MREEKKKSIIFSLFFKVFILLNFSFVCGMEFQIKQVNAKKQSAFGLFIYSFNSFYPYKHKILTIFFLVRY
jgi:hypothetical protein